MGLFDKKKDKEDIEITDSDVSATVDKGRRFFVIVENVTTMLDGNGCIVTGLLTGNLQKNDNVYIYQPGMSVLQCQIQAVEATIEERTAIVDEAEDTTVSLQLSLVEGVRLIKYAVITNIPPQEKFNTKVSVENPALAGIINGMTTYGKDNGFHGVVAYWICHSYFLIPIKMDTEPKPDENGKVKISKDTKIGFYMLRSKHKLTGTPEDKDSIVLPIFTDWDSLRLWKDLGKDGQRVHTQILRFPEVYGLLKRGDVYNGIAINPFNRIPCTLPIPYLDTITNTPGYKKEFEQKDKPEMMNA